MGIFENFPYTNFHKLNLDWILSTIKKLDSEINEFVQTNVLTYAEPIQWDITTQYAKNTVVVGPDGTAYMSIAPVPTNILLTNTDYWQPIFTYSETVTVLKKQIAAADMGDSKTALVSVLRGGLFWQLNTLYRAKKAITAGDGFIVGSNCELCTVEEAIKNIIAPASDIGRSGKNVADSAAETAKRTARNIIDSASGDYTETSDHKTVEATQITEHTTANREVDVDGANSLHVDGANTVNIGGLESETFAGNFGRTISGKTTKTYESGVTETYKGSHAENGKGFIAKYTNEYDISAEKINLRSSLPAIYNTPEKYNDIFNSVKWEDRNGKLYDVLVAPDGGINIKSSAERRFIFMADSYGVFHSTIDDKNHGWPRDIIARLGFTGDKAYDLSMGSRGFAYNPVVGTFQQGLKTAIDNGTIKKPESITDLFVCGGTNDMVGLAQSKITVSALQTAVSDFVNYAKTMLPNASIYVGFNGFVIDNSYVSSYNSAISCYKGARLAGADYIENLDCVLADRSFHDGIHPTPDGFTALGDAMIDAVVSGCVHYISDFKQLSLTLSENITINLNSLKYRQTDHNCALLQEIQGIVFNVSKTNLTFTDLQSGITLGKLANSPFAGTNGNIRSFMFGSLNFFDITGSIVNLPCLVGFNNTNEGTYLYVKLADQTPLKIMTYTGTTGNETLKVRDLSNVKLYNIYMPVVSGILPFCD